MSTNGSGRANSWSLLKSCNAQGLLYTEVNRSEFVVMSQVENQGSHADFIDGADGTIHFLRMNGRLYDRVADETDA